MDRIAPPANDPGTGGRVSPVHPIAVPLSPATLPPGVRLVHWPVAMLAGRRHFAWRPVTVQDGRRVWLRFVFRMRPVFGIHPTYGNPATGMRRVAYADHLPHMHPGIAGWIAASPIAKAWRMRTRFALYAALWLAAVTWIGMALGWLYDWPAAFGGLPLGGVTLYWPGQFLTWGPLLAPEHRWTLWAAGALSALAGAAVLLRIGLDVFGRYRPPAGPGLERWAGRRDLKRARLLGRRGGR